MNNLYKYNDFLFESIINDIFLLLESDEPSPTFTWDMKKEPEKPVEEKPVTFEWDLTKTNNTSTTSKVLEKLKAFLSKLPKDQVIKYFYKLLDKIKLLPEKTRRKLLINYASVFLLFGSVAYLTQPADQYKADKKIVKEFI
jgi:hypothetical protein